ncbi:uncharacterized protein LOC134265056 [Saccostrea cucullata]|uniref:uncharacterized protein LOC134265056 n=1 Tax=Saccostrea cuccullata TaxID=36930 RepID=UPI002ECFEA5C
MLKICTECDIGFFGDYCHLPCRYPGFGKSCQRECDCVEQHCHHILGCSETFQEEFGTTKAVSTSRTTFDLFSVCRTTVISSTGNTSDKAKLMNETLEVCCFHTLDECFASITELITPANEKERGYESIFHN